MKKIIKCISGFLFALCIVTSAAGSIDVSAATVDDVIAYARSIGMPESEIQKNIAEYGDREWSSEECEQAIAILKNSYVPPETDAPQTENSAVISESENNSASVLGNGGNNIADAAGFGITVENTGISRTFPVMLGGGFVLLSASGIILVLRKNMI